MVLHYPIYTYKVVLWSNTDQAKVVETIVAPLMHTDILSTLRKVWKSQNPESEYFPVEVLESTFCCRFEPWANANPKLKNYLFNAGLAA